MPRRTDTVLWQASCVLQDSVKLKTKNPSKISSTLISSHRCKLQKCLRLSIKSCFILLWNWMSYFRLLWVSIVTQSLNLWAMLFFFHSTSKKTWVICNKHIFETFIPISYKADGYLFPLIIQLTAENCTCRFGLWDFCCNNASRFISSEI